MGTQLPPPPKRKGHSPAPIFGPYLLRPNGCMDHDVTWYGGRTRPRRLCVRWGPRSPSPKGGSPQFSAHVYCGQTAGWMKLVLGMEVGLGPGHIVLDGKPAAFPRKGGRPPPQFSAHFYSAPQCSHCKRCISYGNSVCPSVGLSVCLSVCPSHAGIVSKRRHVARCSLQCQIAKCV